MNIILSIFRQAGAASLLAISMGAMASDTFTMNGRSVQLVPVTTAASSSVTATTQSAIASDGNVTVQDMASGQVSVYANGLILTLRDASTLTALLHDYPALTLQYAPGAYAFVRVPNSALAVTFDALGSDPRVAAVHLRPLPVPVKPR